MRLWYLVLANINGRLYRSLLVAGFIMVLAAFLMGTTLLAKGMEHSLSMGMERLGSDIVVVPEGREAEAQEAILLGEPLTGAWMPVENLEKVANVDGVAEVSPQYYLATLCGAACCSAWAMFIIAFDPETDFTVRPWLQEKLMNPLGAWDIVGGDFIVIPESWGEIRVYGVKLNLAGKLERTGMGMDSTMFMTIDTAKAIAEKSYTTAVEPLVIPPDQISAVQVKVEENQSIDEVADRIMDGVPGTYAFSSLELTRQVQKQTAGLFRALFLGLVITWLFAVAISAFVFSLIVSERRREIGMLRAIGASRNFIFKLFLTESAVLGIGGSLVGVVFAIAFVYLFSYWLMFSTEAPLLMPALPSLLGFMIAISAAALLLALPGLLYPALRASSTDPAEAMRQD